MPRLLLKRKVNFLLEDSSVQGQEMLSERNTKIQVPPHQKKKKCLISQLVKDLKVKITMR